MSDAPPAAGKLFVVRRVPHEEDEERDEFQRAFADRAAAEAYCREVVAADRRRRSELGELWGCAVTAQGPALLAAAARELGLPPPPARGPDGRIDHRAFVAWWRSVLPGLTPEMHGRLWEVDPGGRLSSRRYEVVEVPWEG